MNPISHALPSDSFRQAALKSERIRLQAAIVAIALLLALALARIAGADSADERWRYVEATAFLVALAALELGFLRAVASSDGSRSGVPRAWLWLSTLCETQLPTAMILLGTHLPGVGPYQALTAPVVHVYYLFIILSVLRLDPLISLATGLASVAGYLAAVGYTYALFPEPDGPHLRLPAFLTLAGVVVIAGLVAAAVAQQIRRHVRAALHEAQLRSQVEQIERDLNLARSIQRGLLPQQPPQIAGFELAGWSQPAAETGGDYFDWQELPDGRWVISLADVTGHGIGPALVTAVCRAYSRASFPATCDAQRSLAQINDLLAQDLPTDRFVTFVAAILDPTTAAVEILSAGHGPILHYRAQSGQIAASQADELPLNVSPGIDFGPPRVVNMEEGDLLVLVTDGFFEWADREGVQFGLSRLQQAICQLASQPAAPLIAALYDRLRSTVGGAPQPDDVTAVVIKRLAHT